MRPQRRHVVDASVAAKWVLPESDSAKAHSLLEEAARGGVELWAPDLFVAEVANVLWKRCRLSREISEDEAQERLALVLAVPIQLSFSAPLVNRALQLGLVFHRPIYDCLYVALALKEDCQLVSADERLVRHFAPAVGHCLTLQEWMP